MVSTEPSNLLNFLADMADVVSEHTEQPKVAQFATALRADAERFASRQSESSPKAESASQTQTDAETGCFARIDDVVVVDPMADASVVMRDIKNAIKDRMDSPHEARTESESLTDRLIADLAEGGKTFVVLNEHWTTNEPRPLTLDDLLNKDESNDAERISLEEACRRTPLNNAFLRAMMSGTSSESDESSDAESDAEHNPYEADRTDLEAVWESGVVGSLLLRAMKSGVQSETDDDEADAGIDEDAVAQEYRDAVWGALAGAECGMVEVDESAEESCGDGFGDFADTTQVVGPGVYVTNGRSLCRVTNDLQLEYLDGTDYGARLDGDWEPIVAFDLNVVAGGEKRILSEVRRQTTVAEPHQRFGNQYTINGVTITCAFPGTDKPWAVEGSSRRHSFEDIVFYDGLHADRGVTMRRGRSLLGDEKLSAHTGSGRNAILAFPKARRSWAVLGHPARVSRSELANL